MSDTKWSSVTFEKEFLEKIDEYIDKHTVFSKRKEFLKHAAQDKMNEKD